jgi:YVTN family beta-propeller protein
LAVNSVTNTIYVANQGANSVTVIDGATNHTTALQVDLVPYAIAVNQVTNQIYVANSGTDTVTDIDGATLNTTSITVGNSPSALAVNPITNDIYVANYADGTMTMIGGANNDTNTVPVGNGPLSVETNVASNRVYIGNESDGTVSVYAGSSLTGIQFVPVAPCRLVDTRDGNPIQGGTSKSFPITQVTGCEIPATALAYSLNVTLVPIHNGPVGYLTIWPTGEDQPLVSTMNSPDGRIKANAAIVPAGYESDVSVYVTNTTNILLDIDGYFAAPGASTLQFYPLTPCRVVDTRNPSGPLGGPFLNGGQERDFPVLESSCVPQGVNAQAYSMNFTVVPVAGEPLGYLTVWPAGQQRPTVSTLNNPTSTVVANAGIVPAGTSGEVATYPDQNTQLVIDIDGYFAAPAQGGLSLYPTVPCRALDTRNGSGAFNGELTVNVVGSSCAPPSTGRAYVFNATVIPGGSLGYLTLWPDGEQQPVVSTLNALDGKVTSNMAIVPSSNGSIDAYASGLTQLILDISSYFGP